MHKKKIIITKHSGPFQITASDHPCLQSSLYQKYRYVERTVQSIWGPLCSDTLSASLIKCDSAVHINRFFRKVAPPRSWVRIPGNMKAEEEKIYTYKFFWIIAYAK